jgi:hypothetical protein
MMDAENRAQLNGFITLMIWLLGTIGAVGGIVYLIRLI